MACELKKQLEQLNGLMTLFGSESIKKKKLKNVDKFISALQSEIRLTEFEIDRKSRAKSLNNAEKKRVDRYRKELVAKQEPKDEVLDKQDGTKGEFDTELDAKLRDTLQELYPEITLEYTKQEILHGEGVMNQEAANDTVKLSLKVVEALQDLATAKPSKHGGTNQPVLSTIRTKQEAGVRKRLSGKGVPKEQIDFMFEYMRQNDILEMKTSELAERVLLGLSTGVEVSTATHKLNPNRFTVNDVVFYSSFAWDPALGDEVLEYYKEVDGEGILITKDEFQDKKGQRDDTAEATSDYSDLTVPGGTNYQEKEIATPSIVVPKKGHADFATDKGIGWYRVDDSSEQDGTLRVLEMQSDMFQKMKDSKLDETTSTYIDEKSDVISNIEMAKDAKFDEWENAIDNNLPTEDALQQEYQELLNDLKQAKLEESGLAEKTTDLSKTFLQLLNTDNKWVKFFIQSIVQDSQKKGYDKIRFPNGEAVAKIEGHESISEQIREIDDGISNPDKYNTTGNTYSLKYGNTILESDFDNASGFSDALRAEKQELKTQGIEKLAPIEGFYQVRVKNTLVKTYGKENVKTVTDEYGNQWFELELDPKRDSNVIMLQKQEGQIKGQADIEAKTVLINSLLQSQDTLPHEYAHHYIRMFIDTPIVQEAIKKWGSEEALVQAIGEQVVEQKGEAYNWWKKFTAMLQKWFDNNFSKADKEDLKNLLTDAFLERKDLSTLGSRKTKKKIQKSPYKEFAKNYLYDVPTVETIDVKDLMGYTHNGEYKLVSEMHKDERTQSIVGYLKDAKTTLIDEDPSSDAWDTFVRKYKLRSGKTKITRKKIQELMTSEIAYLGKQDKKTYDNIIYSIDESIRELSVGHPSFESYRESIFNQMDIIDKIESKIDSKIDEIKIEAKESIDKQADAKQEPSKMGLDKDFLDKVRCKKNGV